jgi:hypothetical protein
VEPIRADIRKRDQKAAVSIHARLDAMAVEKIGSPLKKEYIYKEIGTMHFRLL